MSAESPELLEFVSELGIAKPDLYQKIMGGEAVVMSIPDNIILGDE